MTDRTISLIVTLDKEYRIDDAEVIVNAIKMIKGVLSVDINKCTSESYINAFASQQRFRQKFYEVMNEAFDKF